MPHVLTTRGHVDRKMYEKGKTVKRKERMAMGKAQREGSLGQSHSPQGNQPDNMGLVTLER